MKTNLAKIKLLVYACFALAVDMSHSATLVVGYANTVGSEQATGATGEGGPFHISVNSNNPGYAAVYWRLPNTNTNGTAYQRSFTDPVKGYSFVGGGTNNVLTVNENSGGLITYTTTDTSFDSFGQAQRRLWTTNNPGANLITPATTHNAVATGYRSFGQIAASINISGLTSGTVNIFYGSFNAKPTVSVVMKDSLNVLPNITLANAHATNNDTATRAEHYVAEVNFVNDLGYDIIEYTYLANGTDNTGNGRFGGTVLTGVPELSTSLLGGLGLLALLRRRR